MQQTSALALPNGSTLNDLRLTPSQHSYDDLLEHSQNEACDDEIPVYGLTHLAPVVLSEVSLYMAVSGPFSVTPDSAAYKWLKQSILDAGMKLLDPHGGVVNDVVKEVGILTRVVGTTLGGGVAGDGDGGEEMYPATEMLFFDGGKTGVRAIALSSHLLCAAAALPSPPETEADEDGDVEARFLELPARVQGLVPQPSKPGDTLPHEGAVDAAVDGTATLKRNSQDLDQLFQSAAERRKKARRKGGAGVGLAISGGRENVATAQTNDTASTINVLQGRHRRRTSLQAMQPAQEQVLSDQSAAAGSRPLSRAGLPQQRSSLNRMTSADELPQDGNMSFNERNKTTISKTVMAGMRIFGLNRISVSNNESQQMPSLEESQAPSVGGTAEDEYKLVYHQTFKGTVFAFRKELEEEVLRPDGVREVVDRLLGVFCGEVG